jgi:uncharacterized protein (TIGR01777 family)
MKTVLISGAGGLIGTALTKHLKAQGATVVRLVRTSSATDPGEICWDPLQEQIDLEGLQRLRIDAAVHLSGENLAARRWTNRRKQRIRDSRIKSTAFLCHILSHLPWPPRVLAAASAAGYYGSRGAETVDEQSTAGVGFLAELCRDWERAARPYATAGRRVVNLRIGLVLSTADGMLARLLPFFRLGLGGHLGSGRQYMSWISIDDLVSAISHCLNNENLSGPVNLVAPEPVTNREFTQTLGAVLYRPTLLPAPAAALRLVFGGEMTDEALLSGIRAIPRKLLDSGFEFAHPSLDQALQWLLTPAEAK